MDLIKDKKELLAFFEEFAAENSLDEAHLEKLERILHVLKPESMKQVKEICDYILQHKLQDLPEDEIIDDLREHLFP
jgi:hypothetical protein